LDRSLRSCGKNAKEVAMTQRQFDAVTVETVQGDIAN
jgi:hypothetical protein